MNRLLMTRQQVLLGALATGTLFSLPLGLTASRAPGQAGHSGPMVLITQRDLAAALTPYAAGPGLSLLSASAVELVVRLPRMALTPGTRLLHIGDAADHELVHLALSATGFPRLLHRGHHPGGASLSALFSLVSGGRTANPPERIPAPRDLSCLIAEI